MYGIGRRSSISTEIRWADVRYSGLAPLGSYVTSGGGPSRGAAGGGYAGSKAPRRIWLKMIDVQEFARRLSSLGADAFTGDDIVDLATAAEVRISADLEIDAGLAQRLLDRVSPEVPVTGAQITAAQWPPPVSTRPPAPPVTFSSPGAVDGPAELPARNHGSGSGPARNGRRPGPRRTSR